MVELTLDYNAPGCRGELSEALGYRRLDSLNKSNRNRVAVLKRGNQWYYES